VLPDTYSEQHRHECEVRWVAALPTPARRRAYLDSIEQRRGKPAADRLRTDLLKLWQVRKLPAPHRD